MNSLCKYKNAFGELKTGIHSYRIMDVAVLDFVVTAIAAYLITLASGVKFVYSFVGLFLAGILIHRLFCVRTTIDKLIFPNVDSK
jgi:hypothetical protein